MAKQSTTVVANVWADGFGIWHAEVAQTGIGDHRRAQRAARAAIIGELLERSPRDTTARDIHTRVILDHRDSRDGLLTSYFREA